MKTMYPYSINFIFLNLDFEIDTNLALNFTEKFVLHFQTSIAHFFVQMSSIKLYIYRIYQL